MGRVLLVVVIVLALLIAIFGVQNPQTVNIRFLGWQSGRVPLYVVILLSTLTGVILSSLLGVRGVVGHRLQSRRQDKQIAELQQQLAERSRTPLVDGPSQASTATISTGDRAQERGT
jgi:uncharacterized integral membrane protein